MFQIATVEFFDLDRLPDSVLTHAGESYGCESMDAIREIAEVERRAAVEAAERLRDRVVAENRSARFDLGISLAADAVFEAVSAGDWDAAEDEYSNVALKKPLSPRPKPALTPRVVREPSPS